MADAADIIDADNFVNNRALNNNIRFWMNKFDENLYKEN